MSAPVLTISEQKASISGKKKKKKTVKNILNVPSNLQVESQVVKINEVQKLIEILERLLPSARLPHPQTNKSQKESSKDEFQIKAEALKSRHQLSLGVNDLARNIKKDLIAAVLLASDIQPKFLINHLDLLCNHKRIPCLHMPGLREITKNSLGFPCIAMGFKKNLCTFSEAIEEIKLISEVRKNTLSDTNSKPESENNETDEEGTPENDIPTRIFNYLYRASTKERIFVPKKSCKNETAQEKPNEDFIKVDEDDCNVKFHNKVQSGISGKFCKQKKQFKDLELNRKEDEESDDDLEVPKKKRKKDWVIDKVGIKSLKYYPANLMRVPSNPNRNRKNK